MLCCRGGSDTDRARSVSDPSIPRITLVCVLLPLALLCWYLLHYSSVSHYKTTFHPVHFPNKRLHVDAWTEVLKKRQIQALPLILRLETQTFCLFVVLFMTHTSNCRCTWFCDYQGKYSVSQLQLSVGVDGRLSKTVAQLHVQTTSGIPGLVEYISAKPQRS